MKLFYLAYQKDEKQFNEELEDYLIKKRQWIIDNNEQDNSSYWIDFPLLACCSYAYDKHLAITVESEYIPSAFFRGGSL